VIPGLGSPVDLASLATMCGRFLSLADPEVLAERFAVEELRTEPLPPRHNVAPSTPIYAIVAAQGVRRLGTLRWGFVPPWTRALKGSRQPINARIETVATSRMFASSFAQRRCLLPADGFYEWQAREGARRKQPYHLAAADGDLLAFAGIWTVWRDPAIVEPEPLHTTAIITTTARDEMQRLHERMPVILPERLWETWLNAGADHAPHLLETLLALDPPRLRATPIGPLVNDVRNEGPDLLVPGTVED
jgi:putative SOS response-associated peptidase YedK